MEQSIINDVLSSNLSPNIVIIAIVFWFIIKLLKIRKNNNKEDKEIAKRLKTIESFLKNCEREEIINNLKTIEEFLRNTKKNKNEKEYILSVSKENE